MPSRADEAEVFFGRIPNNWEFVKFTAAVKISNGQVDPTQPQYRSLPLIAPNHIESGTGRLLGLETAEEQGAESGKYLVAKGDVLYSKIRPALRKVVRSPVDGLCSTDMYAMQAAGGVSARFVVWVLLSEGFSRVVVLESERVAMPKVNRETLGAIRLPFPSIEEQERIANFLDQKTAAIDALIAKKERLIELLQEKRQALVEDAFPWTWKPKVASPRMVRLDSILVERKRPLAPLADQIYQEIGVRSHGRGVFHKEPILGKDLGNKSVFWVTPGDLVFNIVFAWEGAVALTSEAERGLICSHRFPSFYAKDEVLYLPWLVYFFRSREGKRLLELNSPGAAGRNKTLDRRSLMKEYIGLPDVDSQKEVVRRLDAELGHRARTEGLSKKQLAVLKEYRQALISAAVTGQLPIDGGGHE